LKMTLEQPDWKKVARLMLLSRELDRLEVEQLTPQGKVKYQFSSGGHELAQILLAQSLDHPHDAAAVYYRSRPFMLACGMSVAEALAGGMARTGSPSEGRDVGVVYNLPHRDGPTVLPASGDVARSTHLQQAGRAICYRQACWAGRLARRHFYHGRRRRYGDKWFWAALALQPPFACRCCFHRRQRLRTVGARRQTPGGNIAANLTCYANLKVLDDGGDEEPGRKSEKPWSTCAATRAPACCACACHAWKGILTWMTSHTRARSNARPR
jgi:2-oxoisovalerate dehydrogenase E1 component